MLFTLCFAVDTKPISLDYFYDCIIMVLKSSLSRDIYIERERMYELVKKRNE